MKTQQSRMYYVLNSASYIFMEEFQSFFVSTGLFFFFSYVSADFTLSQNRNFSPCWIFCRIMKHEWWVKLRPLLLYTVIYISCGNIRKSAKVDKNFSRIFYFISKLHDPLGKGIFSFYFEYHFKITKIYLITDIDVPRQYLYCMGFFYKC